tara:strand:- start:58 stop:1017 length:960 start_codon:yes stop_codon:yes gene_type:complete
MVGKNLNIILPCFNEEENIESILITIKKNIELFQEKNDGLITKYDLIFVDNCSTDNSWKIIKKLARQFSYVSGIKNSANYGQLLSPFKALTQSNADLTILMCSDFQDPPNLIPKLLDSYFSEGLDMVIAARESDDESIWRVISRKIGYFCMQLITENYSIPGFHGFGLYSRKVVDLYKKYKDIRPYIRLLPTYLGINYKIVEYKRPKRIGGISSNNIFTLFQLSVDGIIQFGSKTVDLITYVGLGQWLFCSLFIITTLFIIKLNINLILLIFIYICVSFSLLTLTFILQFVYRSLNLISNRPIYSISEKCGTLESMKLI